MTIAKAGGVAYDGVNAPYTPALVYHESQYGYVVVEMKISDPEQYKQYMAAAPATIMALPVSWA